MRKLQAGWLAALLLSLVIVTGCERSAEPETAAQAEPAAVDAHCSLSMGWDPWEPYHFSGAGGLVQGLDVDLTRAIAAGAGCELEFVQGNWASLLRLLQAGELDLLAGATRTPEREAFAWFSSPYRLESFQLFVRTDDRGRYAGRDLESLLNDGFRLGVTQGYIYGPRVTELQANPDFSGQIIEAAVGELNFTHLLDYRIDGFLEDPFVAAAIRRRRADVDAIEALADEISSGPVHLMFSMVTVDEELAAEFDRSLEQLKAAGDYQQIIDRYLE